MPVLGQLAAERFGARTRKILLTPAALQPLRVIVGGLRRKIDADPAQPRYIVTETRIGYRLSTREPAVDFGSQDRLRSRPPRAFEFEPNQGFFGLCDLYFVG